MHKLISTNHKLNNLLVSDGGISWEGSSDGMVGLCEIDFIFDIFFQFGSVIGPRLWQPAKKWIQENEKCSFFLASKVYEQNLFNYDWYYVEIISRG